jgi:hypothetical protein
VYRKLPIVNTLKCVLFGYLLKLSLLYETITAARCCPGVETGRQHSNSLAAQRSWFCTVAGGSFVDPLIATV